MHEGLEPPMDPGRVLPQNLAYGQAIAQCSECHIPNPSLLYDPPGTISDTIHTKIRPKM